MISMFFFLNDTATTEIYTYGHTLSLHDALPLSRRRKAEREAGNLNHSVQIYAHEPVFYRKDRPKLIDEYRARQHRHFTTSRNIVENIVHDMPGVPARNTALDFLEGMFPGN